jgi:tetratricopeptide (TPR) repeat protein
MVGSLSGMLLGFLMSTASKGLDGYIGNKGDKVICSVMKSVVNYYRHQDEPDISQVLQDLEKAVLLCYLSAQRDIAKQCTDELASKAKHLGEYTSLPEDKLTFAWLLKKIKSLETNLKNPQMQTTPIPLETLDEIEMLVLPSGELNLERLEAVQNKLVDFATSDPETPQCFRDKADSNLIRYVNAYFSNEIKNNEVVYRIFSVKLLAQANETLQGQTSSLKDLEQNFRKYADQLPEMHQDVRKILALLKNPERKPTEEKSPHNIPLSGVVQFVGREAEMNALHQKLQSGHRLAVTSVQGMGGIGKTELALQYSRHHYEQGTYPGGVCWFQARDEQRNIGTQITTFAHVHLGFKPPEELDLPQQVTYCWQRWSERDVLVIFDNVTAYRDIEPYLPPANSRFKVLLTTRLKLGSSVSSLDIDILGEEAALDLLRALLPEEDRRVALDLDTAKALCRKLGYLPLGLELVGRYLARKLDLSLVEMQERLEKKGLGTGALDRTEPGMTARLGVRAAFGLSWQELDEQAQELACLISLFAPAPVPWGLVQACLPDRDSEELEDLRDEQLVKLSLLKRTGEGVYQLHQLLREFFREKLDASHGAEGLKREYCQVLVRVAQQIPNVPTREVVGRVLPLIPHLAEVATSLHPWVDDENLDRPFRGLSSFYAGQGAYAQAQPWSEKCLAVCRERLGEEHLTVALCLNDLAYLYFSQSKYDQAEPLYLQALEMKERLLGKEHLDVTHSLNNLAGLYESQGHYEQAETLHREALAIREKVLGLENYYVGNSLNNLAMLYARQGKYNQAEPLYERALAILKKALEPEHPHLAQTLNNLALLYEDQGKYNQAEPLLQRALAILKKALGPKHPDVAQCLNNLAGLYRNQGRYGQAESLFKRALDIREKALGPEHPNVVESLNNLAVLYFSQGRYAQAEPLYKRALDIQEKVLGPDHPEVATSLNNLAVLYSNQGRYEQAKPLSKRALAIVEKVLGPGHPNTITAQKNYTALLKKTKKKGFGSAQ